MNRKEMPAARFREKLLVLALLVAALLPALACAPPLLPRQAPPAPLPGVPVPSNLEATVEAMVTERVREALAAIPTVTPAPTATPLSAIAMPPAGREPAAVGNAPSGLIGEPNPMPTVAAAHAPNPVDLAGMVDQVKPGVVRVNTADGVGSGIIFEKLDGGTGLVLTNYHVVEDSYRIDVLVAGSDNVGSRRTFRARLVGFDQRRDLAVLEMCCDEFPTLELSATADISAGSEVVAIGYALGLTGDATVTRGIVSAVRYHPGMRAWVIQTDASINPGNSGGPLLLPTGEVIGITTFIQNRDNRGSPTAGLGFAVSERSIRGLLPDLKEGAKIVLAAEPNAANRPGTSMDWQTYTNDTHHYTVDVPEGWLVDESDRDRVHFDSPDGFAGLALLAYDKRVDSVDQWIDDVVGQHTGFYRGRFQLVEREIADGGEGSKVAHVVFRARISRSYCLLRVTEVFHRSSAGNFVASFHICEHSYSRYSAVQQAALSSIKLHDGG